MKKNEVAPGSRFGLWTVIGESGCKKASGEMLYQCLCECGRQGVVGVQKLLSGKSRSCGHCGYGGMKRVLSGKKPKRSNPAIRGVHWNAKSSKWEAEISVHGERRYLGQFSEMEDAIAARMSAENELRLEYQDNYSDPEVKG